MDVKRPGCGEAPTRQVEASPAKTACIYVSSVVLVVTVLSGLSLLRFIISICHYEYTTGRTVCSPQNVVLDRMPVEIPSRTLFLRIGGSEYCDSVETFNVSKHENHDEWERASTIEHSLVALESSNFSRFKNLRELTLFRCGVERIGERTFANLTRLRKLSLRNNRLLWIRGGAFSGLANLSLLDLSNNPLLVLGNHILGGSHVITLILNKVANLSSIESETFHNASVENLIIGEASLTVLSRKSLSPLKDSLKSLVLADNSRKLSVDEKTFEDFILLKSLNLTNSSLSNMQFLMFSDVNSIILDYNIFDNGTFRFTGEREHDLCTDHLSISKANLSEVPEAISKLYKRLRTLILSGNRIQSIRAENFCDMNHLLHLDLSHNIISTINSNVAEQLPLLSQLRLHENLLSALPQNLDTFFYRLKEVTVSGNPLHCNCDLKWFSDWLKDLNSTAEILEDLNRANCSAPVNVNILQAGNSVFLCHEPKIEKSFFVEPADDDVIILECSVTGDPPPIIAWQRVVTVHHDKTNDDDVTTTRDEPRTIEVNTTYQVDQSPSSGLYVAHSTVTISSPGNFTCVGRNSMGATKHTFDTNLLPITKKRFRSDDPRRVQLLASVEGAVVTALLLLLIGFLIKRES